LKSTIAANRSSRASAADSTWQPFTYTNNSLPEKPEHAKDNFDTYLDKIKDRDFAVANLASREFRIKKYFWDNSPNHLHNHYGCSQYK